MKVTIPDSLQDFVEKQANPGGYPNADAFSEALVRTEEHFFSG